MPQLEITNQGVSTGTTPQNPDIRNISDLSSYANTAWDPPEELLCAFVFNGRAAGGDEPTSFTRPGPINWELVLSLVYDANTRGLSLWALDARGLGSAADTIAYPAVQLACYASFFSVRGVSFDGVQSVAQLFRVDTASGVGTSGSVAFANMTADDLGIGCFAHSANEVVTKDPDWTNLDDMNGAGPATGLVTQYRQAADSQAVASWTTSTNWGGIAGFISAPRARRRRRSREAVDRASRW